MAPLVRVLLITGSTRRTSSNSAALRTAIAVSPAGVEARLFDDLGGLPAFNPEDDHDALPLSVARLREQISWGDGVLFCTPEYAGTLPGSFKNLLDWTVGGGQLYGKPVGWINVAAEGRGDGAITTLKLVLSYVSAHVVDGAVGRLPIRRDALTVDGLVDDHEFRSGVVDILEALSTHVDGAGREPRGPASA